MAYRPRTNSVSKGNNGDRVATATQSSNPVSAIVKPRLPYPPEAQEKFNIDADAWKALVEAVFPNAQSAGSVWLALSYCKARNLDVFKRNVHIVAVYDKDKRCYVDTIWPGIGELRTTAFRTKQYAGRDATQFGDDITHTWQSEKGPVELTFPEWAQVRVYRMIDGQRVAFDGPPVFWLETFASTKDGAPNSMWQKRPRGQLDKCAEAAALRAAFPEELGDIPTSDEGPMLYQNGSTPLDTAASLEAGIAGCKDRMRKAIESTPVETNAPKAEPAEPPAEAAEPPEADLLGDLRQYERQDLAPVAPSKPSTPSWLCERNHAFAVPKPQDGTMFGACPTCGSARIRRLS